MADHIEATYEVPWQDDLEQRAQSIAVGMTVGSWVDVPALRQPHLSAYLGHVVEVEHEGPHGRFTVRYPCANVRSSISSLLTVVFGKLSLDGQIRLVRLSLPESYIDRFPGPQYGIEGLREELQIGLRPMVMSIFKSENGRTLKEFEHSLKEQLDGGVDFVKDDEIFMADNDCPLLERVKVAGTLLAARQAHTGQHGLYFTNLSGTPAEVMDQAFRAEAAGASGLMVCPYTQGLDILTDLRRAGILLPLLAHPAFSGGLIRDHGHGLAPAILLGLLPRLAGADIVLFPSAYGSVALPSESVLAIAAALRFPGPHSAALPGPSAGIHAGLLPQLLVDFGVDLVVNAGGAIHGHADGTTAGARALVEGVQDALADQGLWMPGTPWSSPGG